GFRLPADMVVIDVDPRNGGEAGFDSLCSDFGLDPDEFPCVITGSGGFHCYTLNPTGARVVDTLEAYPGVEFKSVGRQVVAPGSIHPNGKPYRWSPDHPPISAIGKLPTTLRKAITRPEREAVDGGGQYEPHELARLLEKIDARDFSSHDKWLK